MKLKQKMLMQIFSKIKINLIIVIIQKTHHTFLTQIKKLLENSKMNQQVFL